MTVGGMGFIPERLLMMMMMIQHTCRRQGKGNRLVRHEWGVLGTAAPHCTLLLPQPKPTVWPPHLGNV